MTAPSDLQAEIERLLTYYSLPVGPTGTGPAYAALRELAAFCYRDADATAREVCRETIAWEQPGYIADEYAAEFSRRLAIARRAKEMT